MIHKATAVALKFFALYLIFNVLMGLPGIFALVRQLHRMEGGDSSRWLHPILYLAATLLLAAIGIGLLWKTANSLVPNNAPTASEPESVDLDKLLRLALSIMGLYFAILALISLPQQWSYIQMMKEHQMVLPAPAGLVSSLLQLGLGAWLIAKPRQWAGWLQKLGHR